MGTGTAPPSLGEMLGRQVDYWWRVYVRTWKGSAVTAFVQPWLYVAALGVLLGGYVDAATDDLGGAPSYLAFIAPGLLAAHAMQFAAGEAMWPVLGALKWDRTYFAMAATPLRVVDIVAGHLVFLVLKIVVTCAVFAAMLAVVGIFSSVGGFLFCLAGAVLTGAALATPIYGFSVGTMSEQGFALIFRLGVMPMFLFSGAFFPLENLSEPLQWLARLTPLWHGVELCRMGSLETWDASAAALHIGYLVALGVLGVVWALRRLERRLVV